MIIPRPASLVRLPGTCVPGADVTAPPAVADLLRELVPGVGATMRVVDDPELGPEGYRLRVLPAEVAAEASTEDGLRWAVQSLRQLCRAGLPCVDIVDTPRYAWRGSLLDVARWCHPLPFLFRYVDLLALHKLNTLHLHLTDDQGWRFEVRKYPRLTEVGGFRRESPAGHARDKRFDGTPHGGFYTQQELRGLVGYAARRGVRVVPEIDAPGHMQAAIAAYPRLGNDPARELEVRTSWGISPHVLNAEESTVDFVRDVLDELVDVFPSTYVHMGGDEVPPGMDGQLGWWMRQLGAHLARHGRELAAWDEVIEHDPPPGTVVVAWQGVDRVAAAQARGFDVVAAPQTHLYLDWAEGDDPGEPLAIRGTVPLETVYGYDPGEVLGLQGQVWSEYLPTTDLVEWRAFPRLAALAEVGWSAPSARDYADFRARLVPHLRLLDTLGVHYRPL